jgi:uncharacterized protein (TIGR00299 family) protein
MKIAYFDCFSGISGDMTLGALLDLGVPESYLLGELKKLPVEGYSFRISREMRGAMSGVGVDIRVEDQPPRTYRVIRDLIGGSTLSERVRNNSLAIFDRIAGAESRVHQVPVPEVRFDKAGAVDSILDIVGAAVGLEYLGIDKVFSSRVPLGHGCMRTCHGIVPVPGPVTVLLLGGVPVYDSGIERELVTSTGAGILTTLAESFGPVPDMTLTGTGYGAGRDQRSDPPNLLRIMTGEQRVQLPQKELLMVETNIDDMNPEFYNYIFERLFAAGALDVALVPMQMKKNRPAVLLRVLVEPALESAALGIIFQETTTLGVRIQEVRRVELLREAKTLETPFGPCRVKSARTPEGEERLIPEYEECRRIAAEKKLPIRTVYEEILFAARNCGRV